MECLLALLIYPFARSFEMKKSSLPLLPNMTSPLIMHEHINLGEKKLQKILKHITGLAAAL